MYYIKVVFNAGACGKLAYGFKVNMICEELEITYNNFQGGYTTKGIKLNIKQLAHLKHLLRVENFKNLRNNIKMDKDKYFLFLDPYSWNLQCISNDGNSMLEIPDGSGEDIMPPNSVINLVEYITKIGIEPNLLEKMRLF